MDRAPLGTKEPCLFGMSCAEASEHRKWFTLAISTLRPKIGD